MTNDKVYQDIDKKLNEITEEIYQVYLDEEETYYTKDEIVKGDFDLYNIVDTSKYLYETDHLNELEYILWTIIHNKFQELVKSNKQ